MQKAMWLVGFVTLTACSMEHVVVAALDGAGAGGALATSAGSTPGGSGGSASAQTSARSPTIAGGGGVVTTEDFPQVGGAGRVFIASGGGAGTIFIGEAGGTSLIACSCLGRSSEFCGTDGVTYPTDCSDAGPCAPPAIACWHACPCLDGGLENTGGQAATQWFALDCGSSARCSDGMVCMMFSSAEFNDVQTTCPMSN